MSWYAESMGWIKKQKLENPNMSREELRKHCSKNYPWRERQGWAYKAWLRAMRDEFGATRRKKTAGQHELL